MTLQQVLQLPSMRNKASRFAAVSLIAAMLLAGRPAASQSESQPVVRKNSVGLRYA
jgi:hypothetical protein